MPPRGYRTQAGPSHRLSGDPMTRLALTAALLFPGLALASGPSKEAIQTFETFGKDGLSHEQIRAAAEKLGTSFSASAEDYAKDLGTVSFDRAAPLMLGIEFSAMSAENGGQSFRASWIRTKEGDYRLVTLDGGPRFDQMTEAVPPTALVPLAQLANTVGDHMKADTCDSLTLLRAEDVAGLGLPADLESMLSNDRANADKYLADVCAANAPTAIQLTGGAFVYGLYSGDKMSGMAVYPILHGTETGWQLRADFDAYEDPK